MIRFRVRDGRVQHDGERLERQRVQPLHGEQDAPESLLAVGSGGCRSAVRRFVLSRRVLLNPCRRGVRTSAGASTADAVSNVVRAAVAVVDGFAAS